MSPLLQHERVTASGTLPDRWLLVLHGIYGAGRNWGSVARRVVAERPAWGAALVDLRQHGGSTGFPEPHTLEAAAHDLQELVEAQGLDARAVLGHSFGGKVALVYGRNWGRNWGRIQAAEGTVDGVGAPAVLEQLWIVDSTPEARSPSGSAWEMLGVLRRVPETFAERGEGVQALQREGVAPPIAQWMATNLAADRDGLYRWRIDPDEMEALMRDFFATDAWDVVEEPPAGVEIHFVKAEESSVLDEAACSRIEEAGRGSGRVHLHRVAGGHWLNADNPDALVALLSEGLSD